MFPFCSLQCADTCDTPVFLHERCCQRCDVEMKFLRLCWNFRLEDFRFSVVVVFLGRGAINYCCCKLAYSWKAVSANCQVWKLYIRNLTDRSSISPHSCQMRKIGHLTAPAIVHQFVCCFVKGWDKLGLSAFQKQLIPLGCCGGQLFNVQLNFILV